MAGVTDCIIGSSVWCRHQMKTFSALLALCTGNSSVIDEFPSQRPVTRSFGVSFDLRLDKRLSKQSRRRWFKRPLTLIMTSLYWNIDLGFLACTKLWVSRSILWASVTGGNFNRFKGRWHSMPVVRAVRGDCERVYPCADGWRAVSNTN